MSKFEAMVDELPEVNEETVFRMLREEMPAQFRSRMDALAPQIKPMIEKRLVEILREKVRRIVETTNRDF